MNYLKSTVNYNDRTLKSLPPAFMAQNSCFVRRTLPKLYFCEARQAFPLSYFDFLLRRQPTPPVKEPEPEPEPEANEQEDTEDLRNKVQKLEEEVQQVSLRGVSAYSEGCQTASWCADS